jgi:predicted SnoaL-like aldol condensation-catalyzing enzyme
LAKLLLKFKETLSTPIMHFSHLSAAAVATLSALMTLATATVYKSEFEHLGCPNTTTKLATLDQQYSALLDFAQILYTNKKAPLAFSTYVAEHLINHAPDIPGDGRDTASKIVGPLLAAADVEIMQVFLGQDMSSTYFRACEGEGKCLAVVDMFRMSGTCLVEHWVVTTPITKSSNPYPYF